MYQLLLNSLSALPLIAPAGAGFNVGEATVQPPWPAAQEGEDVATVEPEPVEPVAAESTTMDSNQSKIPDTRIRLEFFAQDIELGEVTFDPDNVPGEFDVKDIERKRRGFRGAFGKRSVRGYFNIFGEEWDRGFQTATDFEMLGIGGGVLGEPSVSSHNNDNVRVVLPYRAGFNGVFGSEELGAVEEDTLYFEFEGEFGVGVDLWGARPMVGLYASSISGVVDTRDGVADPDSDYSGTNVGGFAELRYKHHSFPLFASIRAQGGDAEGVVFTFGGSF